MGFQNPIVGGTALRIPAIQSPNYNPGIAGWIIKISGDAEFNNLTIRGQFLGADFIINSAGIFLYSGTPANGNLVGSWTSASGTDAFGNAYQTGLSLYSSQGTINFNDSGGDVIAQWLDTVNGSEIDIAVGGGAAGIDFKPPTNGGATWQDGSISAVVSNVFGTNTAELGITSPYNTAHVASASILLFGSSDTQASNRIDMNTQLVRVSGALDVGGVDIGAGIQSQVSITSNVGSLGTTETVLMTVPSMTFTNGRAYRVSMWGLQNSTSSDTHFLYRLRKGNASTSGTIYKDQMRVPTVNSASTNNAVSLSTILVNTSGADITTAVTFTGSVAVGTGTFAASAGNVAYVTIEDVGLASAWPGQPIS